jgi:hypothetical protein
MLSPLVVVEGPIQAQIRAVAARIVAVVIWNLQLMPALTVQKTAALSLADRDAKAPRLKATQAVGIAWRVTETSSSQQVPVNVMTGPPDVKQTLIFVLHLRQMLIQLAGSVKVLQKVPVQTTVSLELIHATTTVLVETEIALIATSAGILQTLSRLQALLAAHVEVLSLTSVWIQRPAQKR